MNDDGKNTGVIIGLHAVVVSVTNDQPRLLVVGENEIAGGRGGNAGVLESKASVASLAGGDALPYGPFDPTQHRTLESGLRAWVSEQTELDLGYVEQLYTFGDRGRDPRERQGGPRLVSVGYLALVSEAISVPASNAKSNATSNAIWQNWYHFLPWEDWREGDPLILERVIEPHLSAWAEEGESEFERDTRHERINLAFGFTINSWSEKLVLERYELLYEAGFVQESLRDRGCPIALESDRAARGRAMLFDHRRTLVIITEWQEFRSPDFDLVKNVLTEPVIFDGRNLYDPELLHTMGITYYAIGRGNADADSNLRYGRRNTDNAETA